MFKQWHYSMNITECKDPDQNYKFPSNSFYPPGAICAVEKWNEFCPTSGESGSPLMYEHNGKFSVAGILSFTKGCSSFYYRSGEDSGSLLQESINPLVYSKIACYLPWIAEQYGMVYEAGGSIDHDDCIYGNGDINEVTAKVCRTIPNVYSDGVNTDFGGFNTYIDNVEAKCLLNFTIIDDGIGIGQEWDGCIVSGIEGFTHPVFKCPIRTIKNRTMGYYYTNYETSDGKQVNEVVNAKYCPTNSVGATYNFDTNVVTYFFNDDGPVIGPTGEYELDPENDKCRDQDDLIRNALKNKLKHMDGNLI